MCVFIAMIGGMLIIPMYMQNMSDFTAMESGLALLPGAVLMGLMSPVTGRIFDAVGAKWLVVIGFTLLTGSTFMLALLAVDTTFFYIAAVNTVRMLGTAMVIMPVTTAALNQLPQRLIPHGTALNNTMRQIAASVGTAVLVTVMVAAARDPEVYGPAGPIHGANVSFFVAAMRRRPGHSSARSSSGTRTVPRPVRHGPKSNDGHARGVLGALVAWRALNPASPRERARSP